MPEWFNSRLDFAKALFWRPLVGAGAAVLAVLGILQVVRDELPQTNQKWLTIATYLPGWPWYVWSVLILFFLLIVVFEAAFRLRKSSGDQRYSKTTEMVQNRDFLNEVVDCDGKVFHQCRFTNVTLQYTGYGATGFVECKFSTSVKIITSNTAAGAYARFIKLVEEQGGPATWQLHEQRKDGGRLEPVGAPELRGIPIRPVEPATTLEPYYIRLACMKNDLASGDDPEQSGEIFEELNDALDRMSKLYRWESLSVRSTGVGDLPNAIDAVMVKIRDHWKSLMKPPKQEP